jgi:hypothetical protein
VGIASGAGRRLSRALARHNILQFQSLQMFRQLSNQGEYIRPNFATIASRIDSLREWPYTALPPWQVALAGFYHDPTEEDPATVICFSCGALWHCTGTYGQYRTDDVLSE